MHVTMVKKQLASGGACRKCLESEEMLKSRGLWGWIDQVIWAVEGRPESEGMQLGVRLGVANAPFYVVRDDGGREQVFDSTLKLIRSLTETPRDRNIGAFSYGELDGLAARCAHAQPSEIVAIALERFGADCAIAFSGAEDVVLIDFAARSGQPFSVFCLDTGRLHSETYRFIDRVRQRYGVEIDMLSPDATTLQAFVRKKGLFSFYEDGHGECCAVRKVEPLKRALLSYQAWMTGQRRDQSPNTRAQVPVLQEDPAHRGKFERLLKWNPLANWSSAQVWSYIRDNALPYNELHERGFASIGCEPCTRAILPGQHEREGRWWWEDATKKECGLHSVPPSPRKTGTGGD